MIISLMKPEDTKEAAILELENFADPWSQESFLEEIDNEYAIYLVAKQDSKVIGVCGAICSFDVADILNVSVKREFRKQGIAAAMINEVMKRARQKGVRNFTLEVRKGNIAAICLYESLGFKPEGIRPNFYRDPREDAYIYWLRE